MLIPPAEWPVDQREEDVGETRQGGIDNVSYPHWPRREQKVKKDT